MAGDVSKDKAPSFFDEFDEEANRTTLGSVAHGAGNTRPYLIHLAGASVGRSHLLDRPSLTIGRGANCDIQIDAVGVSRAHFRITQNETGFWVEDLGSANGTVLNGHRLLGTSGLSPDDKIQIGVDTILKFARFDEVEERYHSVMHYARGTSIPATIDVTQRTTIPWYPGSWRDREIAQAIPYDDPAELERVIQRLRTMPPLVTSGEVEDLKRLIADAQQGKRFLLQGGDGSETHDDCSPTRLTTKLKIMIQMSLVLTAGLRRPVIRVGRLAGQYCKASSAVLEKRDGLELPSYRGDMVNRPEFTREARRPDPQRLLSSYYQAALTLNFVRAVSQGDLSDLRRPGQYDLCFSRGAELPASLEGDYRQLCRDITEGLEFLQVFGEQAINELTKVNFYASHQGLNLHYEEAQTILPPRRTRHYCLTTHMPWIGERTRALTGAHVDFFRGVANPIGVKIGAQATGDEVAELCRALNPNEEPGKLVLITRMGTQQVAERLPPIIASLQRAGRRVLWVSDPMHGNSRITENNRTARNFDDILGELERTIEVHRDSGTHLGGVHFEFTGEDVTECRGHGLTEEDLSPNNGDPRLNYRQALQMAFLLATTLGSLPSRLPRR